MSKVLLVSTNMEKNPLLFPLGIGYIRAALDNAGADTGVLDFGHVEFKNDVLTHYLDQFKPDFIGVSIRNIDNCCMRYPRSFIGNVKELVEWIRKWDGQIPIILGGSGFSLFPVQWLDFTKADYGIVGNGIKSFPLLISKLQKGEEPEKIPGLVSYKNGKWVQTAQDLTIELDEALFPNRNGFLNDLIQGHKVRHNVQTKAGCGLHCIYCAYPALEGSRMRLRLPRNVVDEIQQMTEVHGIREFDFVDSVFNFPQKHAEEICAEIAGRKLDISWGCFLHPSYISGDFMSLLKDAGCSSIEFGIDSGSEKCLRALNKNFGRKEIAEAARLCKKAGITFNFCLLIGGPGETRETLGETLMLLEECEIEKVFGLMGIRILPYTGIYEERYRGTSPEKLFEPRFYFSELLDVDEALGEIKLFQSRHPEWIFV